MSARDYELSIQNDPATRAREHRELRRMWKAYRAKQPELARRIARMSDAELERYELTLLEQMPQTEATAYALRLAHELAQHRAMPRPKIARRKLRLPAPDTPAASPLARYFEPSLLPPPTNPETQPTPAP